MKIKKVLINQLEFGDKKRIKQQTGFCYASINKAIKGEPVSRHIITGVEMAILNIIK